MSQVLLASAARTADGNQVLTPSQVQRIVAGIFMLNVTAAATEVDDTLDVFLQASPDDGTTWDDFVAFTQVLGNGGAKKFLAHWNRNLVPTVPLQAPVDAGLAAGVRQGPVGDDWRLKWLIVDAGGAAASFTFAVTMDAILAR